MIICDDNNKKLPNGISGEIYIKTPSNFRCYWNDKNATNEAFYKGWFKTGDIGFLDEDNYLFIVDRAKDIVIRGGENISCLEVEDSINSHPYVLEASVYGIPDERLGEILCCSLTIQDKKEIKEKWKKGSKFYLRILNVAEAFAISIFDSSHNVDSEKPMLFPTLITLPSPINFPTFAAAKNIVLSSSVTCCLS